jgi:hypothetical protein
MEVQVAGKIAACFSAYALELRRHGTKSPRNLNPRSVNDSVCSPPISDESSHTARTSERLENSTQRKLRLTQIQKLKKKDYPSHI